MNSIERFNIADVARIHGLQILHKNSSQANISAVCPFCGDTRGKFSFIIKKGNKENMYNCYHCGAHGNAIDLHIALSDKNYAGSDGIKNAAKDIFTAINGDTNINSMHYDAPEVDEAEKADDAQCSSVYYALLGILTLDDVHKKDLLRRGFTEEDIRKFRFRSVPQNPSRIINALLKKGCDLNGVPGFFRNKRGYWSIALPGSKGPDGRWTPDSGYFCPVFDGERNLILGFQIRLDHPTGTKGKYIWFSSSGRQDGVGSGAIATYLPGKRDDVIIVIEGILKSTAVYTMLQREITIVGIPGTKCLKSLEPYINPNTHNVYVYEAFDMDKDINEAVEEDRKKLIQRFEECNVSYHPLRWDVDASGKWQKNYKGLDDFLNDYPKKELFAAYLETTAMPALKTMAFLNRKPSTNAM